MRYLVILALCLSACAKKNSPGSDVVSVQCAKMEVDAIEYLFPDGTTRKSNVFDCNNGCKIVEWVNDSSVSTIECSP